MGSLYGGKPGMSFVIVKTFSSVDEMYEKFKQGPNYTTVHFDEYVLINTKNKNDSTNGNIYRRGNYYTNEVGGAIYIGSIVGPAGRAPLLEVSSIEDVLSKYAEEGFDERKGEGSYDLNNGGIVPGKNEDGTFNDSIEWAFCSVRDPNGEDSIAYIGFRFPYLVIDFKATTVTPYFNGKIVERIDDKTHPFFEYFNINIKKGIKGDSFKNLRSMIADASIQDYPNKESDILNKREVLVADFYNFDAKEEGDFFTIYVAQYNIITDIELLNDGTLIFHQSYNNEKKFSKAIKWIDNIFIDANESETNPGSQKIKIVYNSGESNFIGEPLNYIMRTAINEKYQLLVLYSDMNKRNNYGTESYDGIDGWVNLGSIKDYNGILIGPTLIADETNNFDDSNIVISYLNTKYPNGLESEYDKGKVVIVQKTDLSTSYFGFLYSPDEQSQKYGWDYIGQIGDTKSAIICKDDNSIETDIKKKSLSIGGIWLIVED